MSMQSPVFRKTLTLPSWLMGSTLSLIMIGTMTGCQTTEGLSSASTSVPVTQVENTVNTPYSIPKSTPNKASNNSSNIHDNDYPISETESDIIIVEEESEFDTSDIDSDRTTEEAESNNTAPVNHNTIDQTRPTPSVAAPAAEEVSIIKPRAPDAKTTQQILLEQARQNSKKPTQKSATIQDGSNIPAFRKLMDTGVEQLRQGQVSAAQSTFTRAQRLAPQSSAVYFYLGQVALKQNQPLKAEAMARRGLVVATTESRKRALWQVILKAGQAQGNARVIKEAKAALSR